MDGQTDGQNRELSFRNPSSFSCVSVFAQHYDVEFVIRLLRSQQAFHYTATPLPVPKKSAFYKSPFTPPALLDESWITDCIH